ncbi:MAG: hypothetical protein JKY67_22740 [Pseudomonadales bacterium]|nr:hypothetical protein [Pseudomonadales bacterium]
MQKLKLKGIQLASLVLLCTVVSVSYADLVVVANRAVGITSLTSKNLKRLYLGKTFTLPDGTKAKLADQRMGGSLRNQFYLKCCSATAQDVRNRWAGILFSGNGQPPAEVGSDKDVLAWVAANQNGLGYIDSSVVDDTVKVLITLK